MSDEERPEWKYICRECRKTRDGIATEGTAETLARIHRVLSNGHVPEVMPHA